jgi:hypothetical protein
VEKSTSPASSHHLSLSFLYTRINAIIFIQDSAAAELHRIQTLCFLQPHHAVGMEDFEEWHRRGFKAEGEEFEAENISKKERGRISKLAAGERV